MSALARDSLENARKAWLGRIPFHPMLIAAYLVLYPYSANQTELTFESVRNVLAASIGVALVLLSIISVILRNGRAAGVITTLVFVCLAYYGLGFEALDDLLGGTARHKYFLPYWVVFFAALVVLSFIYRSSLENATRVLNVSLAVLVLMPLSSLILDAVGDHRSGGTTALRVSDRMSISSATPAASGYPDIYYLIFDRYADNRTLNTVYNHDNSGFLDRLGGLGFYVARRSRANYTKTAYSLASSLNLRHVTDLSERLGPGSSDWKPLYSMMQDHDVARVLKAYGYDYAHLGSWWGPTRKNDFANENFIHAAMPWGFSALNEFELLIVESTLPARIVNSVFQSPHERRRQQFLRVQKKFKVMANLRGREAPLFVFAHMLLPHDPYVFFPDGAYKTRAEAAAMSKERNYIDQVVYANLEIGKLVQALLKREPQPIIVIQADEGPFPKSYLANSETYDWREAAPEDLREKFRILNAIYFPDKEYSELYQDITPVNTFRIIFNRYFGQDLPLLPDTSYSHVSEQDLYSFFDVTAATQ